jgi:prepilin-type N-terminal cleavage/methylation domain-containing protein
MKVERGYTLVELIMAIAITGFLTATLGLVVQQTVTVPERGDDQVNALHAIQNAAHWVSLDGQTAKSASGGSGLALTLPDDSSLSYILYGDELHRVSGSSNRTIARGIASASFSVEGRLITMNITAAPDSRWDMSESGTYQINMRPTP